MIPKIVETNDAVVRAKILEGARAVYDAVKATYSPKSGNVGIEIKWGAPVSSHDGVTVAQSIHLADNQANIGARLLIEASQQTNRIAGDGTSATVILGYHLIEKANKLIAAGYNAMELRRGMERAASKIMKEIDSVTTPVTDDFLHHIAIISSGDEAIGHLIADTIIEVGDTAGVTVEEYQGVNIEAEVVQGFHFGRGTDSPYMWNEIDLRRSAYDEVYVLTLERKMKDVSDIRPVLEQLAKCDKKNLLIIGDVSGQALEVCVSNRLQGLANIVTVAPITLGNQRSEFLQDVATVAGGKVIDASFDWSKFDPDVHFGWAERIIAKENSTTIFGGAGDDKVVKERIELLKRQVKELTDATQIERLEGRLAKLSGKVGVLKVGAPTETDRKEKMLRVDDAVMAARAAREEGIVPGGATTLLRIGADAKLHKLSTSDFDIGYKMVFEAIQEPFRILLNNTGVNDIGYHKRAVIEAGAPFGYNVRNLTDEPLDLMKEGVVDPSKVVKQSLQNAIANAGVAITMNALVTFDKEEILRNKQVED